MKVGASFLASHKLISLFVIVFITLTIPLTVLLSLKNQDYRSKAASLPNLGASYNMPVLVLNYFPTQDGINLDSSVTGFTSTLADIRSKVDRLTNETKEALQAGSTYHGYKNPAATPALNYSILDTKEYLTTLPLGIEVPWKPGQGIYRPDYGKILTDLNICDYVDKQGLREVWLFGWHYGNIEPAESVMSGPNGDVSNSGGGDFKMPLCSKSYVLYNYNYQGGTPETTHDHGHQIEIMLKRVDNALMESKFIGPWTTYSSNDGSGASFHRCGWTHNPPNTASQYDYINTNYSWTDCEDWNPEGTGQKVKINCNEWNCDQTKFHIWRWQNMPGKNNGSPNLTNWWDFVGDFDKALASGEKLTYVPLANPPPTNSTPPKIDNPKQAQIVKTSTKAATVAVKPSQASGAASVSAAQAKKKLTSWLVVLFWFLVLSLVAASSYYLFWKLKKNKKDPAATESF